MNNDELVSKRLGVNFRDSKLLHNALVHRSYLNESRQEDRSNERLEFLGDAVLEFLVSEEIYKKYSEMDEGKLTALRSRLVNTTSLSEIAKKLDLGEALYLSRGEEESGGRQNSSLLADTFEAIIGAIFLDQGIEICKKVVNALVLTRAEAALKNLKDPKSLLQEVVQAQGKTAPIYKVIEQKGPDHAKVFTVKVAVGGNQVATGSGKSKQIAEQEAAGQALRGLEKQQK